MGESHFLLVSSTSVHVFVPVFVFMASCRKKAYYLKYKCVFLVVFFLEDREANWKLLFVHMLFFTRYGVLLAAVAHRCWITIEETLGTWVNRTINRPFITGSGWDVDEGWRRFKKQAAIHRWNVWSVGPSQWHKSRHVLHVTNCRIQGKLKAKTTYPPKKKQKNTFIQFIQSIYMTQHG